MADVIGQVRKAIDNARSQLEGMGFREFRVVLERATITGADPIRGIPGTKEIVEIELNPAPKVELVDLKYIPEGGVLLKAGDVKVSKISRDPAFEDAINDPETVWRIEGPAINGRFSRLEGVLEPKPTEWVAIVRNLT